MVYDDLHTRSLVADKRAQDQKVNELSDMQCTNICRKMIWPGSAGDNAFELFPRFLCLHAH